MAIRRTERAIEVAEGATADGKNPVRIEMEKFTPEGGTEQTPAVTEKIVAKADIVVASEEGVSVTVNAEGDAKIETEGEGEIIEDSKGGPLPGVFSVSATKKVQFSPGNLYVKKDDSGNWNLNFYDEQYACNSLNSKYTWKTTTERPISEDDNESDLFSWGYGKNWSKGLYSSKYYVEGYDNPKNDGEQFSKTEDWGYAFGGESSVWRTLTKDEWAYLLNTRTMTNSEARYSNAVDGVNIGDATYKGVFLYPDNYNGEDVSSFMTWDAINAAGIVFLPAAGYSSGAKVKGVEFNGAYWTSSGTSELGYYGELSGENLVLAYYLSFGMFMGKGVIDPNDVEVRYHGNSVRLVTDVQ